MSRAGGIPARRMVWGGLLVFIMGISAFAPLLNLPDPLYAASGQSLKASSATHPLGTDLIGRDVLSRLWYGGRQTLESALAAAALSILPGALIGLIMGSLGGWIDLILSVILDALLAFPPLLLALAIITLLGNGVGSIILAVGFAGLPIYARVARSAAIAILSQPYIEAARSIGARSSRIMLIYILPNAAPTLISFAGVLFSWALLNEAALAFLGFTGDPAAPDWGVMLAAARITLLTAPWQAIIPGALIALTVLAANQFAATFGD